MGYTLTIGNAVPHHTKDHGELFAKWTVEHCQLDTAPTFPNDEMTANTNSRSPSYTAWHDFCREVGIEPLFYDKETGLIREHPGCFMLQPHHHATVADALKRRKEHSHLPPGFEGWGTSGTGKYDYQLARLMWLEWWMRWALDYCATPAIENT